MIRLPMTPRFRRLWYADVVSVVGDALTSTTMLLWVYWVGHHRAVWVSASVLAGYLPRVLAGPLLGGLADRVDRRRLMMATDVIRVVVALTVAFAVHMRQPVPALVGLALMAAAGQVFGSAQQALIPATVPPAELSRANAIMSVTGQASFVIGPAAAVALLAWVGPAAAVLLDALTFAGSALLLAGLRVAVPAEASESRPAGSVAPALRAVAASRVLRVAVAAALLVAVSAGVNNTVMVLYLDRDLGGRALDVAWLSAANGTAQIAAGAFVIAFARRLPLNRSLAGSLGLMAVFSGALAVAPAVPVAIVAVVCNSMANAPFNIAYTTIRQTAVADAVVGRVFAVTAAGVSAAFLLGSVGGGWLADATSARVSITASAGCLVAATLLAALSVAPSWWRPGPPVDADRRDEVVAATARSG